MKKLSIDQEVKSLISALPALTSEAEVSTLKHFQAKDLNDRLDVTLALVLQTFESNGNSDEVVMELISTADPAFSGNQVVSDIVFRAKRPRGRPCSGNAMTPAQKQKAYRERRNAELKKLQKEVEKYKEQLHLEHKKSSQLAAEIDSLNNKLEALKVKSL